ncbi:MAG TPA: hypothetical protein VIU12_09155 [Chryseolinea sp.]
MKPVIRVQPSADYVIDMLLNELGLRIPGFGTDEGEVCLLYETDSFYGRSMVDVFNERYASFTGTKSLKPGGASPKVPSYPYLKGIDGNVQSTPAQTLSKSSLDIKDPTVLFNAMAHYLEGKGAGQVAQDQRQIDYLRRLAQSFRTEGKTSNGGKASKKRIRAIGVFGTNVSDKIQIIEIFRKEFSNVWLFTVDLDAAFINNPNPLSTRNVLIGSAMDVSVSVSQSNDVDGTASPKSFQSPIFRDSFQSAAFLSVLHALGHVQGYRSKPGVWETSRTGFQPLKFPPPESDDSSSELESHEWSISSLDEEEASKNRNLSNRPWFEHAWSLPRFANWPFRPLLMFLSVVLLAAISMAIVRAWRAARIRSRAVIANMPVNLPVSRYWRTAVGIFAAITTICLIIGLSGKLLNGLEPFFWFNGTSVWPSLIIRAFAGTIGFYFFMKSFIDIDESADAMRNEKISSATLSKGLTMAGFQKYRGEFNLRYFSTLLTFIGLFVMLRWILTRFVFDGQGDAVFTPARGAVAFVCHEVTLLFSMAVFQLLIWSAVLRHLRCRELLLDLLKLDSAQQGAKEEAVLKRPEIDALFSYNEAVVQSITYPFAMLVALLASRHPMFDAWNFPQTLVISFTIILLILVCCAFLLNDAANHLAERQNQLVNADKEKYAAEIEAWQNGRGSFLTFWKQPVIQALFLAATGLGLQLLR